jgi:hypothetical protein
MDQFDNYQKFELSYSPKYIFPIFYVIVDIFCLIVLVSGLISTYQDLNLFFIIVNILFFYFYYRITVQLWEIIGRETIGIGTSSIIIKQKLLGITSKRLLDPDQIKKIELVDLDEIFLGKSYYILGYTQYKIVLQLSRKRKFWLGKYMTKVEAETLFREINNAINNKTRA